MTENQTKVPGSGWANDLADRVGIFVCVCRDGKVEYLNPTGLRVLDVPSLDDVLGHRFLEFTQGQYRELYDELFKEAMNEPDGLSVPMKFLVADGSLREMDVAFKPLNDLDTSLMLVEAQDISERKHATEVLRHAYEDLEARVAERAHELTQEIGERRRAEASLRMTAQVINRLNEGVISLDMDFYVTSVNPAFSRITGYGEDDIIGCPPPFFSNMGEDNELQKEMHAALNKGTAWDGEFWDVTKSGTRYAANLSVSPIGTETDELVQYAAVLTDVTKRKEDEERIRYQANFDEVTRLPNRTLFFDRLTQAIANTERANQKLGLLYIDLDGFKLVNDTLGHDAGDELLRESGARLHECVRSGDTVARLGGDEFTVIMPSLLDGRHINIVAQRILNALSSPFQVSGKEAVVSASIGITIFPDDGKTPNDLLKNADSAMYSAKENGKSNFQFYTSSLNTEVQERLAIKNGLLRAVEREEFDVFYQPKLNLHTRRIESVEALMRWNSEELGSVSPVKFIPMLEESGMVVEVGEWVLQQACQQHKSWLQAGLPPIRVAVNLSARQLRELSFVGVVHGALSKSGVPAESLEIEITESMLMSDSAGSVVALQELHDTGIHIAMDDFGTGYSSLSYLKRFPIDTIKIDRSFVADIASSSDDAEIIRTIISMGRTLNRRVVAEGVESKEQLEILESYRCDEIQGYYFSRPLPGDDATDFLLEYHANPPRVQTHSNPIAD